MGSTIARPETADLIEPLQRVVTGTLRLAETPPVSRTLEEEIEKHLPVFIYFDNYGVLDSSVYLPRLLEDLQREPTNPRVRTIDAMFKHVRLTAQEVFELGRSQAEENRIRGQGSPDEVIAHDRQKKELRSIKLNSASTDISRRFSNWWKQRRHKIRYDADGDYFRIWVSDDRRPDVEIELEARSQGFQWFFSFYLVFIVESEEGHKDAVLLLDEPGLHLHPTAQQELIAFFEHLAEKNQLLFTTHSPFLIDGDHLHRVRPVSEDETGHSRISIDGWPKDRETIFPLQAAAGYAMVRGLFQHRKNILVEGMSEYFYLHSLSLLCRKSGRTSLPDDVYITPCGGTKLVGHLASLFLGQRVRPLVLLDDDAAGRARRDALLKELYLGHDQGVLTLDEVLGRKGCEVEDLVGEEAILSIINEIIGQRLALTNDDRSRGSLPDQITAAVNRLGITLPEGWKPEVARRVAVGWTIIKPEDVPADILDRAAGLFAAINQRFAKLESSVTV